MKRLRIGIDAHVVTGRFQGTRTTLTALLRALATRAPAHDVTVYADDPDAAREAVGPSAFRFSAIGCSGSIGRLLRAFPRLFRRDRIDVGVFQYISPPTSRVRQVVFIHDILPITHPHLFPLLNRWRIRLLFGLSIRRAAMVVTVSDYTRRAVLAHYRLAPDKVRTILNGPSFPPATYATDAVPAADRYILAVGRIEARKNVPLLVEAFRRAGLAGVRLVVVGAFDLGFAHAFPPDLPIDHRTRVSETELIALYRGASLFVFPSEAEGFGIPLLDALLLGVPTIASNRTAMAEIAGGLAAQFDPCAPDAVQVLARLIAGHFSGMSVSAPDAGQREELAARFNWDRAATQLIDAIEVVAAQP